MIGKCDVCGHENVEVFEVEKFDDTVILCCDDCWEDDDINFDDLKMYKNVNNGVVLNSKELAELHLREWNDMWNDKRGLADDFETKEAFIEYMLKNDIDTDFVEIEGEK